MVNPRFVIKAVLSGQRLNINVPLTVAGTVNYIGVEAKCTSEWDDCTVVCYLYQAGTGYTAQLGLIYDAEKKLYYFPNAERLTLTAGEWAVWFVGVMAESGQETYRVTSDTRYFNVYPNPFASSIPPGDISLDEEAIARATDAQNKANLLLDKYNAGVLTGPQGDPGEPAHIGFVQASVDNTTTDPRCAVTVTESPDNTYNMQFAFAGIKGAKGDKGDTGPKGDTGAQGAPGRDGTDGRDGVDGETIDDYVLVQAEQPTSETNKMWLKPTASGDPIMIPSAEEFQATATDVTNLKNGAWQYRGNIGDGDPTAATVKIGTYAGQKKTGRTGYPDDMYNNNYCFIMYPYISSGSRSFILYDSTTGDVWIYCADTYHKVNTNITPIQTAITNLQNGAWQYRGDIGDGDPTAATVKIGTYAGQKKTGRTGYPDDMYNNNYCFIMYPYISSGSRSFILYDSTTGDVWIYCANSYHKVNPNLTPIETDIDNLQTDVNTHGTAITNLQNGSWQYRGNIGSGDPTTATVKIGTYSGQKKTGRTGYPDDMPNNRYCFILYQYIGSGSRAFTIFDSTSGIEWIYCNGKYHRVSQASFLNGKKWACIGDSLTYPGTLRASAKYYDYIVNRTGISFINLGVSGTGYVNDGGGEGAFITRVPDIPDDCDVVTIFGSGNDMNALPIGTATDTTNATVMGNVYLTIQAIFTQKPKVLLGIISPTPWAQYPPYDTSSNNKMLTFTTELEKLCRMYSVPFLDLYHESNLRPWDATFRQNYYSKDGGNGVHPDENGNARFAPMIQKFLEKIVVTPLS